MDEPGLIGKKLLNLTKDKFFKKNFFLQFFHTIMEKMDEIPNKLKQVALF
jgi:hypothetical protein